MSENIVWLRVSVKDIVCYLFHNTKYNSVTLHYFELFDSTEIVGWGYEFQFHLIGKSFCFVDLLYC